MNEISNEIDLPPSIHYWNIDNRFLHRLFDVIFESLVYNAWVDPQDDEEPDDDYDPEFHTSCEQCGKIGDTNVASGWSLVNGMVFCDNNQCANKYFGV